MRLIIAGSRDDHPTVSEIDQYVVSFLVRRHAETGAWPVVEEVVSGTQEGVDQAGEAWARANDIPITPFEPNWNLYGLAAGPIRNRQMAQYGTALLLIWNGRSPGSTSMLDEARRYDLPTHQVLISNVQNEGEEES